MPLEPVEPPKPLRIMRAVTRWVAWGYLILVAVWFGFWFLSGQRVAAGKELSAGAVLFLDLIWMPVGLAVHGLLLHALSLERHFLQKLGEHLDRASDHIIRDVRRSIMSLHGLDPDDDDKPVRLN